LRKNKNIVFFRKLQDAPVAQIRGGFIIWDAIICEIVVRDCLF